MEKEKYTHLIYLQAQGFISSDEEKDLQAWLQAAPENQQAQKDILTSLALLDDFEPNFEVDLDEDYAKIRTEMFSDEASKIETAPVAKVRSINKRRSWLSIAAAISLLIIVGIFWLQRQSNPSVEWLALETGVGEQKSITLSDGTKIQLNEKTQLSYPNPFTPNERLVKLKGEAFFDVAKNPNKAFIINTDKAQVKVLGTSFNVKAYPEENTSAITVKTGKVQFSDIQNTKNVILTPNQTAVLNHQSKEINTRKDELLNDLAWYDGKLAFRNTPLKEIFKTLEKQFKVKINCENKALNTCAYSMTKRKVNLETLLNDLKQVYQFELRKENNTYFISKGNCVVEN